MVTHTHKKRGASLSLVPRYKGLRIARIVETSNAESPTPMFVYNPPSGILRTRCTKSLHIKHPLGRSRCFVFDNP